ncbi:MAG: hypothetical protein QG620_354 [Patescibacteria group bacterium]|nr:hypothetical protein [Patescibacteria group bacterium]
MVVPKRALLIQSIINLRVLKKEAEILGLQLMIVTQDKLGKLLIEKAGILVQQKLDDISDEEMLPGKEGVETGSELKKNVSDISENIEDKKGIKERIEKMGSDNYFTGESETPEIGRESDKSPIDKTENERGQERIVNRELVLGTDSDVNRTPRTLGLGRGEKSSGGMLKRVTAMDVFGGGGTQRLSVGNQISAGREAASLPEDKKIENFFSGTKSRNSADSAAGGYPTLYDGVFGNSEGKSAPIQKKEKNVFGSEKISGSFNRLFLAFGAMFVVALLAVAGYLFIPKATVSISVKEKTKSIDTLIKGDPSYSEVDYEKEAIPSKLLAIEHEVSKKYGSSGKSSVSGQKARGTITIYNEFGSSPQPLVATTRFVSEDGKLFRLAAGVTVPGTTKVGEETKPGVIEADVVADEAGQSYNIGPGKFSIPGFKDSGADKYVKFYAVSAKAMSGGGGDGQEASSVSQEDIDTAKKKILAEFNGALKQKIKEDVGQDAVILDDALFVEEPTYKISNSVGEVTDNFEISIQSKAQIIIFKESDLKNMVNRLIEKSGNGESKIDIGSIRLTYGKSSPDFKTGSLDIKVGGTGEISASIDLNNLKKNILGKNNADLEEYLSTYPDIEKVEVMYWPNFFSNRIPSYERRVEVVLDPVRD